MSAENKQLEAYPNLTAKEAAALRLFERSQRAEIAPDTAGRMFQLFLQGNTCERIHNLNTGFLLGQIVHARIKGEWDRLKDEYLKDLLELTRVRAMQSTLESTNFVADMLAVANLEFGEKLRRFMLTRNPADLGDLRIDSLKDYKDAVTLLQALTGQDKQSKVAGEVVITHRADPNGAKPDTATATDILALLAKAT